MLSLLRVAAYIRKEMLMSLEVGTHRDERPPCPRPCSQIPQVSAERSLGTLARELACLPCCSRVGCALEREEQEGGQRQENVGEG